MKQRSITLPEGEYERLDRLRAEVGMSWPDFAVHLATVYEDGVSVSVSGESESERERGRERRASYKAPSSVYESIPEDIEGVDGGERDGDRDEGARSVSDREW